MENLYRELCSKIKNADAVLIGASNGLSIAEGYHIFADDDNFRKHFRYFRDRYGIPNIIQGIFAPLPEEEHRKFMDTVVSYMITSYSGSEVYQNLYKLVSGKDYFILTSTGDTHFQINGFDDEKVFEIEGNFIGREMHDAVWHKKHRSFQSFLQKYQDKNVVVLELGIGKRNQMIKAPLMQLVADNAGYSYITMNLPQEIFIPESIQTRSTALCGNIADIFQVLIQINTF